MYFIVKFFIGYVCEKRDKVCEVCLLYICERDIILNGRLFFFLEMVFIRRKV